MNLLPNATDDFRRLNPHLFTSGNVQGNVARPRGIRKSYETTDRTSIQDSKRPESASTLGGSDAGTPQGATRPIVRITSHRVRLLDKDNLYRGAKALLDALRYAGAISGDTEDQIDYRAQQIKVAHRTEEKTVIEIEY